MKHRKLFAVLLFLILFFGSINFVLAAELNVPFSAQAPFGDWKQPWFDACEETSLVMVDNYFRSANLSSQRAHDEILKIFDYKNNTLGASYDEGVDKMLFLISNLFDWQAQKISNPSLNLIKQEIDNGRPIIAPVAGDLLDNPHFRGSVPYHVLVIKGYDDETQEFIVNDPGTFYGASYRYSYSIIMSAIHDFVARDAQQMLLGAKYVIFTFADSLNLADGCLIKSANQAQVYLWSNYQKRYIVSPQIFLANGWQWSQIRIVSQEYLNNLPAGANIDSVINYQPTEFEKNLTDNSLIKSLSGPKVYLFKDSTKNYIISPQVFINHGWRWSDIKIVSQQFLNSLNNGTDIKN